MTTSAKAYGESGLPTSYQLESNGNQLFWIHKVPEATSVSPISVTTASQMDPKSCSSYSSTSNSTLGKAQMQCLQGNQTPGSELTITPYNSIQPCIPNGLQTSCGITFTSQGVAFRGGGITLSSSNFETCGLPGHTLKKVTMIPSTTAPRQSSSHSFAGPSHQTISTSDMEKFKSHPININSLSDVYSSASLACVKAQQSLNFNDNTNASRLTSNVQMPTTTALTTALSISKRATKATTLHKYKYHKTFGGKATDCKELKTERNEKSPQIYLDELLCSRGYCARSFCSLEGGYYCKPTPLQKASYGVKLIDAIRRSDARLLQSMLQAGLSPNPCNSFGESAVHMVCRRGDHKLLQVFLQAGCSLQITDDFGRTPLHDACWTAEPQFDVVDLILQTDVRLLHIVDCRGSSPLSYVKKEHWSSWIKYLKSRQDQYWPIRSIPQQGEEPPPRLCMEAPHTRPVADPPNALPVEVAQQLSSGKLSPDSLIVKPIKSENDLQVMEQEVILC